MIRTGPGSLTFINQFLNVSFSRKDSSFWVQMLRIHLGAKRYAHREKGLRATVSKESNESYGVSTIQNLHSFHPFADASKGDDLLPAGTEDYIHIKIQQRNGRKTLTFQGITDDYDEKKLVKVFKKKFTCNGTAIERPEYGEVIQPQGDKHKNKCQFLVEIGLAKDNQLKVHGF
ncbi:eukaryotic translation initiation factor 1-like [Nycticebus coucang]|uniref:eukaryotic translation initiation factor 1-like n=1 Tax=Nycticebus coucang TaxID=9470 RepID=UPI00234DAA8B|nr:eukaryotic translation initiation factor 1-like [Nycticebus coucang]